MSNTRVIDASEWSGTETRERRWDVLDVEITPASAPSSGEVTIIMMEL